MVDAAKHATEPKVEQMQRIHVNLGEIGYVKKIGLNNAICGRVNAGGKSFIQ